MIFIDKSGHVIPVILTTSGVAKRDEHINHFIADEAAYRLTTKAGRKFTFDSSIYGHTTVKDLLKIIQNKKCCFCESKFQHVTYGDVEHFKPKAAYSQGKGHPLMKPGYFWLAYDWENLLLSCQICNQREKGNYFPLKNPIRRFADHLSNITFEEPWFINPSLIDPIYHITFHNEVPTNLTFEGAKTIEYLGLDRAELNEERLTILNFLQRLEEAYMLSIGSAIEPRLKENFFQSLREIILNNGQYKSMVVANFRRYIPEL